MDICRDFIQKTIINRLEGMMGSQVMATLAYDYHYRGIHPEREPDYAETLHEMMVPYYEMYLNGDERLCRDGQHLENIARLMKDIISEDDLFGRWASEQDLIAAAEGWGNNLKRFGGESRRIYRFFHVLELLFESDCQQDWLRLSDELKDMLFKSEMCYDYKTDEVLCVLHGFTMIMQQDWTKEKRREQLALLLGNWLFLKHYYSVMTRHPIGVKWTRFHKIAETVRTASQSFKPHMHIFYCGLLDCADELQLDRRHRRELDNEVKLMQEELNRVEKHSELLYELCDALFPEDFQRLLREHKPKSYKEVEDESRRKDEIIRQLQSQTKHLNDEIARITLTLKAAVEASIPVEDIEHELMELPAQTAWGIFQSLNELLSEHETWRRYDIGIRKKLKARLAQGERTLNDLTESMKAVAERPTTTNNVYPQKGSTANIGCAQQGSEFKTYLPEGYVQSALEKNEENRAIQNGTNE